jgi:hypothetical protein
VRRKTQIGKWFWLLILFIFVICMALWLEWMGSKQPQKMIEQPVSIPAAKTGVE